MMPLRAEVPLKSCADVESFFVTTGSTFSLLNIVRAQSRTNCIGAVKYFVFAHRVLAFLTLRCAWPTGLSEILTRYITFVSKNNRGSLLRESSRFPVSRGISAGASRLTTRQAHFIKLVNKILSSNPNNDSPIKNTTWQLVPWRHFEWKPWRRPWNTEKNKEWFLFQSHTHTHTPPSISA